ncbi:MAG: biopolymer transporter ExbD [Gammaproteobacteria bacterium RIFCSPLOWO2_02_FULL_61_13]|nr:MAG: biopolymer transporter ExbD [Gammaproteobacteria bacterium RIFCSPLOWO2_02_FULL_61_13]
MSMSMGPSGGDAEVMMDINTTPLIDVMLVLLVMLIITIPIQTHAVKLDMPQGQNEPPPVPPEVIDLEVDFDGTILWNGSIVPNQAALRSYFLREARKDPQPEVHLRPHRLSKYDHVATVLASAQRLGIQRIGFVGNEQYLE